MGVIMMMMREGGAGEDGPSSRINIIIIMLLACLSQAHGPMQSADDPSDGLMQCNLSRDLLFPLWEDCRLSGLPAATPLPSFLTFSILAFYFHA